MAGARFIQEHEEYAQEVARLMEESGQAPQEK